MGPGFYQAALENGQLLIFLLEIPSFMKVTLEATQNTQVVLYYVLNALSYHIRRHPYFERSQVS